MQAHLTPSQRSMVAARARDFYDKQAKERQRMSEGRGQKGVENFPHLNEKARDAAGKAVGVSGKSVDYATKEIYHGFNLKQKKEKGEPLIREDHTMPAIHDNGKSGQKVGPDRKIKTHDSNWHKQWKNYTALKFKVPKDALSHLASLRGKVPPRWQNREGIQGQLVFAALAYLDQHSPGGLFLDLRLDSNEPWRPAFPTDGDWYSPPQKPGLRLIP